MEQQQLKTLWQIVKGYFNVMPDKEDEVDTVSQISSGVTFHGANLWVLIFAIFIASLGLNVNSTAVIIGAMLISPLMGPIIGMGLAVGISDLELLKRSAKNYLVATVISVLTATIYFLLTPLNEAQSELLARTSPTLYDVLIALCGGAVASWPFPPRAREMLSPASQSQRLSCHLYVLQAMGWPWVRLLSSSELSISSSSTRYSSVWPHSSV